MLWHFLVRLSIHKSTQNDLAKGEIEGALFIALEDAPNISVQETLKNAQKGEEKNAFRVPVDGPFGSVDGAIKGTEYPES